MKYEKEIEELLYRIAERQNPFNLHDICEMLGLPKYNRRKVFKEAMGFDVMYIGKFVAKHPDFEQFSLDKSGAKWVCKSAKNSRDGEYTDEQILEVMKETSKIANPFDFFDICLYFNLPRNDNGKAKLKEMTGITSSKIGQIVRNHNEFAKYSGVNYNRVKWIYTPA